jgi:dTDP-4-dehydrorhamnose reductase
MTTALVGHTGFVGSSLQRQTRFDALFRRNDVDLLRGREFELIVCAAAPAQKWIANREPEVDRANLARLMAALGAVRCTRFVLISTVDVFAEPRGVDEATPVAERGLHPYGLHRRQLEQFVETRFPGALIVRLPGLVGPGLRKNVLFDALHDHQVERIDSRGVFQFYPMVNLWSDICTAMAHELPLLHLTAAPLSVGEVFAHGFGRPLQQALSAEPARYDLRTRHARAFGAEGDYQYTARESLLAIRAYAQSEPQRSQPA